MTAPRAARRLGSWSPPAFLAGVWNPVASLHSTRAVPVKPISGITRRPGNYTFGHLSQKMEIYFHTEICSGMFISTSSVIVRIWKQPRGLPHVDMERRVHPGLGGPLCGKTGCPLLLEGVPVTPHAGAGGGRVKGVLYLLLIRFFLQPVLNL